MKTLAIKLAPATLTWLKSEAAKARKKEATLVREWLEERQQAVAEPSCFDLMKPLWRSVKGPPDLSQREGLG